ncbi:hypothetical protein D7036_19105 [Aquimarina sp. BL5]|uniref:hypothetical protein n=1 Tax=Aquimarina sp. BL5 TaxID=1714860 RepID=UPI000ED15962|nr:hypothetical protein [Aquimarina sp. BL5]RKN00269.1 hypothetical protein D7036_19105 [Aquimarina sp. BL5]
MNTPLKKDNKYWTQFLNKRSLFSAIIYSLLLLLIISSGTLNTIELLYLEIYNATLFYIILNMILFSKDVLQTKSDLLFSNELIEILMIIVLAAILIISLYLSKDSINAFEISQVIVKVNATFVVLISLFISGRTRSVLN